MQSLAETDELPTVAMIRVTDVFRRGARVYRGRKCVRATGMLCKICAGARRENRTRRTDGVLQNCIFKGLRKTGSFLQYDVVHSNDSLPMYYKKFFQLTPFFKIPKNISLA